MKSTVPGAKTKKKMFYNIKGCLEDTFAEISNDQVFTPDFLICNDKFFTCKSSIWLNLPICKWEMRNVLK